jgi:hypothetical protein
MLRNYSVLKTGSFVNWLLGLCETKTKISTNWASVKLESLYQEAEFKSYSLHKLFIFLVYIFPLILQLNF